MSKDTVCRCGEILVKSLGDSLKIRSRILLVRDGSTIAVCKSCGSECPIPLVVSYEAPAPKLVLSRKKVVEV